MHFSKKPNRYLFGSAFLGAVVLLSGCSGAVIWDKYYKMGQSQLERRQYPAAENSFTLALKQAEHFGPTDEKRAQTLNGLATCYLAEKRFADAERAMSECLDLTLKNKGPEDGSTIIAETQLADVFDFEKKYDDALKYRKDALVASSKKLGKDHKETLVLALKCAEGYSSAGNVAEATKIYKRVIENLDTQMGANNPQLLPYLKRYAELLKKSNNVIEAQLVTKRINTLAVVAQAKPVKSGGEIASTSAHGAASKAISKAPAEKKTAESQTSVNW